MEVLIALAAGLSIALLAFALSSKWLSQMGDHPERVIDAVESGSALKKSLDRAPSPSFHLAQILKAHEKDRAHPWWRLKQKVDLMLLYGGNPKSMSADNMLDLFFYSFTGGGFGLALYAVGLDWSAYSGFIIGAALGTLVSWSWLSRLIVQRQTSIRKDLPTLLDLLTLCVEAGMDFTTAMMRVGPKFEGAPLGQEVQLMLTELRMGKSRQDALRDLSSRVGLLELSTVINSIVQSDQLGASMGPALRIQSEDMRKRRMLLAEEMGMKAPVKLMFPLVVFIFPTTFMVLFGPMAIKMMS